MGRFWSLVFLLVPIGGVGAFVVAPLIGHWLPDDISEHGYQIDGLFMFILWLTGAVFVATEVAMFWFMWKYDAEKNPETAKFTHGNHNLEVIWTLLPAATLLFIAIFQINAWADVKIRKPAIDPTVEVTGRQFEWRIRYPYSLDYEYELDEHGKRKLSGQGKPVVDRYEQGEPVFQRDAAGRPVYVSGPMVKRDATGLPVFRRDDQRRAKIVYGEDDIYTVNDLHVPLDEPVLVDLKSADVLHSFFLPNLRVKQDAVPGSTIPVWFRPKRTGKYDLVCAELCGWGHYKMRGRLIVESRAEFDRWQQEMSKEQKATQ